MKTDQVKPSLQKDMYYATLLEWITRDSDWLKVRSFAPGGWAVDFCYLYVMYRALNACQPKAIVEYGLGQSTRMLSQYHSYYNTKLATIEHDQGWVKFYNQQCVDRLPLHRTPTFELNQNQEYAFPGDSPIPGVNLYDPETYYPFMEEFIEHIHNKKVQFVSVDAPFGTSPFSRVHLLDFLKNDWLDTHHFVVMVDDMEREGEKNTVKLFTSTLKNMGVKFHTKIYSGEKPHIIIVSDDLKFLCSM